jgi:hypothetical protein
MGEAAAYADNLPLITERETPADATFAPATHRTGRRLRLSAAAVRWIAAVVFAVVVLGYAAPTGLQWRQQLWTATASVRFTGDIQNGLNWGLRVTQHGRNLAGIDAQTPLTLAQFYAGYTDFYDRVFQSRGDNARYGLDYTPLRLLIMSTWAWQLREADPGVREFRDELALPLLKLNRGMEIAATVLAMVLVVQWRRKAHPGRPWYEVPSTIALAACAGAAVWLHPALIWNTHGWPQWDAWLLPFFLLAAVCATAGWWTTAGASIAIGAMLKGQILFGLPLLLLWPIFRGNPLAAARVLVGLAGMTVLLTAPWLLQQAGTKVYVAVALLTVLVTLVLPLKPIRWRGVIAAALVALALGWPLLALRLDLLAAAMAVAAVVMAVKLRLARPRLATIGTLLVLVFATTALLGAFRFGASWAWYEIGFEYPERNHQGMGNGMVNNLPVLLANHWGWQRNHVATEIDTARWTLGLSEGARAVTINELLRALAMLLTIPVAAALAHAERRGESRGLLAFAAGFLVVCCLVPQMHERYLLWPAVLACLAIGTSLPGTLLAVFITLVATAQMMMAQLPRDPNLAPTILQIIRGAQPGIAWAVLLAMLSWLYLVLRPTPPALAPIASPAAADEPADRPL